MPTLTQRILYTLIYLYIPHSILLSSLFDKVVFSLTFYFFVLCSLILSLWSVFLRDHHVSNSQLSSLLFTSGPATDCHSASAWIDHRSPTLPLPHCTTCICSCSFI